LLENLFKAKTDTVRIKDKQHKIWMVEKIDIEKYTPIRTKKEPAPFE